jgi:hypothetical protein
MHFKDKKCIFIIKTNLKMIFDKNINDNKIHILLIQINYF